MSQTINSRPATLEDVANIFRQMLKTKGAPDGSRWRRCQRKLALKVLDLSGRPLAAEIVRLGYEFMNRPTFKTKTKRVKVKKGTMYPLTDVRGKPIPIGEFITTEVAVIDKRTGSVVPSGKSVRRWERKDESEMPDSIKDRLDVLEPAQLSTLRLAGLAPTHVIESDDESLANIARAAQELDGKRATDKDGSRLADGVRDSKIEPSAGLPVDGDWLMPPESLIQIARKLGSATSPKRVKKMFKNNRLQNYPAGHRQSWTLDKNGLTPSMREKLEKMSRKLVTSDNNCRQVGKYPLLF